MQITATCNNCQKRYKVDSKLGGKKAHCKNCGASFVIPKAETPELETIDPPVNPRVGAATTADKSKARVGAPTGSSKVRAPAKPLPKGKASPAAPPKETGEMDFAEPPCPGCGKSLPQGQKICLSCGYNRATGQKMEGAKSGTAGPAAATASGLAKEPGTVARGLHRDKIADEDHDYQGMRLNKPYVNPFLNFLDTWVPRLVVYLIVGVTLLNLALTWYSGLNTEGAKAIGPLFLSTFVIGGFTAIFIFTTLAITNVGIGMGAKMMKANLPEDRRYSRIIAASILPSFFSFMIMMIMVGTAALMKHDISTMTSTTALTGAGLGLLVFIATSIFTFAFFFRLRLLESLVTYLFYLMFYVLGVIVSMGILVGITFVIGLVFVAGSSVVK